jgi:predicted membrane protein DUF2231
VFDAIGNMPLHPLVIHAVVIGIPLAVLLAVLFAVPLTRSWARWPLAVVAVGSLVATFVARESGEALYTALKIESDGPVGPLLDQHMRLAGQLFLIMIGFTVVALASVLLVGRRGEGRRKGLSIVLLVVLLGLAGTAGFWVYRVGDVGSRAVWNPTGTVDYSVAQGR